MLVVRGRDAAGTDYDDLSIWLDPDVTNLGTPHYAGTGVFREQYGVDAINAFSGFRIRAAINPAGYSAMVDELRIGTSFETGLPSAETPGPVNSVGVDLGRNQGQDLYNFWAEAPDKVVQWDAADKTNPSQSFDEFGGFTATFTEALEGGNGSIDARIRTAVSGPRGNLLEDAFKDGFGLKMTIEGLDAGLYQLTTYHHDNNTGNEFRGSLDIVVSDAEGGDRLVADELMQTYGDTDENYASATFLITADGANDVVVRFLNGDVTAEEGNETEIWLNGFTVTAVPEPGIAATLVAGMLLLGVCRLRGRPRD